MDKIWILVGIYIGILAILDIKYQRISLRFLLGGSTVLLIMRSVVEPHNLFLSLAGAGIGSLFLLISYITKEAFGYADSILIILLGAVLGLWDVLELLFIAFFLSAGFAMIQMIRHHFSRKTAYPFIPFLAIAYVGVKML